MNEVEYVYSSQEEFGEYCRDDVEEAILYITEGDPEYSLDGDHNVTIYRAVKVDTCVSDYTPDIVEYMQERVYDEYSDVCESFVMLQEEQRELQELVDNVIVKFMKDRQIGAGFYKLKEFKAVEYKITIKDGELASFEELSITPITYGV